MKKLVYLLLFLNLSVGSSAQSFIGAWEAITMSDNGEKIRNVVLFSQSYQVLTKYKVDNGEFIMTNGGSWKLEGNTVTEVIEFDTKTPERVGTTVSFPVYIKDNTMGIVGDSVIWTRIDDGTPGKLSGAWLFSGRVKNGEIQSRDTNQPRKTMKLMSGTRFQWIAYNTETKEFKGTGGGTYSTIDGEYTENIEFFSRDNAKVGLKLKFNYELTDGRWNHSGFSSKGDPIHEIWTGRD